jgi:putative heme-binding domain-containing protein
VRNLAQLNGVELAAARDSPSGWQRDTAQRLLMERSDPTPTAKLEELVANASDPRVRLQSFATLQFLKRLDLATSARALRDPHPSVRVNALRVLEVQPLKTQALWAELARLADDPEFAVRRQLALTLGEWKSGEAARLLTRMAERDGTDPQMRVAILSSAGQESPLMKILREENEGKRNNPAPAPIVKPADANRAKVIATYAGVPQLRANSAHGREVFRQTCAVCHRFKGDGRELGPDLAMVAAKADDWLLAAIFDPNQAIEARYQAQHVVMKDGSEAVGLIAAETGNNITLRSPDGSERAILRSEIRETKSLGRSLMPEGLEGALKPQDLADLIGYLRAK